MDISLKQRLLGGALLVAMAVIFLPMLFDGSAREEPVTLDMDVPPEPAYTFAPSSSPTPKAESEAKADVRLAPPAAQLKPARVATPDNPATDSPALQSAAPGSTQADMPDKPKRAKADRPLKAKPLERTVARPVEKTVANKAATELAAVEPPAELPPPAAEPAPPSASAAAEPAGDDASALGAWAVQVGSFSEHDNAQSLRDELKASGFAAFEEKVQSGGQQVFRVKVGPEPDRARAEALRDRLQSQEDLQGIVVSHPRDAAPVVLRGGG
ncbi:MAG: SPOR domain-containing protein [Gammaproteobacteria bacterium]